MSDDRTKSSELDEVIDQWSLRQGEIIQENIANMHPVLVHALFEELRAVSRTIEANSKRQDSLLSELIKEN